MDGLTGDTTATASSPAPATSATPSASPTVGSGTPAATTQTPAPTTMAEGFTQALDKLRATDAKPTAPAPIAAGSAPDGTVPDTTAPAAPIEKPKGPIPFDQHAKAIENARIKGAAEAEARLGWAKDYHPEQVKAAMDLVRDMAGDPVGFVRRLAQELQSDPKTRALIQTQRQAAQGPPAPDMETADGRTKFYSEKGTQALVNFHVQRAVAQVMDQMGKRLTPIEQERQQTATQQRQAELHTRADREITDYESKPLFKENLPAIVAEMEKDGRLGLAGAYARVVVPQLTPQKTAAQTREQIRAELATEMERKATAGSFNPGAPSAPALGARRSRSTLQGFREGFSRAFASKP